MVREHLPRFVSPMLARSGLPTDAEGWAYEVKFDGMRAQLRLDGRSTRALPYAERRAMLAEPSMGPAGALRAASRPTRARRCSKPRASAGWRMWS